MVDMDLFADLGKMAEAKLTRMGYPPDGSEDPETLLIRCIDLDQRVPPQLEWTIKESNELQQRKQKLSDEIIRGLEKFNQTARAGEDIVPHTSRHMKNPDYLDDLLVDWNVIHFHLGQDLDADGFISRTDELLFAVLDQENGVMYQLDVHPHDGAWARKELVNILERNWPKLIEPHELKGLEIEDNYTDEEIAAFRKIGANVLIQTESGTDVVSIGGGKTTAGTSMRGQLFVNRAKTVLGDIESKIVDDRERLEKFFRTEHGFKWGELAFRLTAYGPVACVEETNTGKIVAEVRLS